MSLIAATICFITCHVGPAEHFASFVNELKNSDYKVEIVASGPALKKFQEQNIEVAFTFSADSPSLDVINRICNVGYETIIADVSHPFTKSLFEHLIEKVPQINRVAYYDHPESYVPGGYSEVAAEVMKLSHQVLFANANLASQPIYRIPDEEVNLQDQKKAAIGFYPMIKKASLIAKQRQEDLPAKRADFFHEHELEDTKQKLLVYFGGNNTTYFEKAFPAFLSHLKNEQAHLSDSIILIQQHPAVKNNSPDLQMLETWKQDYSGPPIILSKWSSDQILTIADAALYYQTSMSPVFALAGVPTIQVAHETYNDLLVREQIAYTLTTSDSLESSLKQVKCSQDHGSIHESLGIKLDWKARLKDALNFKKS